MPFSSTAITVDDNAINEVAQEEIFENIKLHKEVLSNVKMQPWNMRKKLKLVVQAKSYIKKHEGQLQERLAQSHSTKDMLARWNIVLIKVGKWVFWPLSLTLHFRNGKNGKGNSPTCLCGSSLGN